MKYEELQTSFVNCNHTYALTLPAKGAIMNYPRMTLRSQQSLTQLD